MVADFAFPLIFIGILGTSLQAGFGSQAGGLNLLANLSSQRAANQIFPFVMLPQFFLAGIFNPIQNLPLPLDILSHLAPMRYAVDLLRDAFYGSTSNVVLLDAASNLAIIGGLFVGVMGPGPVLVVCSER